MGTPLCIRWSGWTQVGTGLGAFSSTSLSVVGSCPHPAACRGWEGAAGVGLGRGSCFTPQLPSLLPAGAAVTAGSVPCGSPGGPTGQDWQLPVGWPRPWDGCQHLRVLAALLLGGLVAAPRLLGSPQGPCSGIGLSQGPQGLANPRACLLSSQLPWEQGWRQGPGQELWPRTVLWPKARRWRSWEEPDGLAQPGLSGDSPGCLPVRALAQLQVSCGR